VPSRNLFQVENKTRQIKALRRRCESLSRQRKKSQASQIAPALLTVSTTTGSERKKKIAAFSESGY